MSATEAAAAAASAEELLATHRDMVLLRVFDEEWKRYAHQGRVGNVPLAWGLEALYAGSMRALGDEDWVFPSYRETAAAMLRGVPMAAVLAMERGHPGGWWDPFAHRVAPPSIPVGSHIPHAVGFAWGTRLAGREGCAIAYFGDGATSEGAFHEGMNYAALTRAPVVLVCNNNGWAISTPVSRQTAVESLAAKADGYGMPGVRVDGNDVLAVRAATAAALERARSGGGPTLIESVTLRTAPHAAVDDPTLYMEPDAAVDAPDCVARFEGELAERGLLDDGAAERLREEMTEAARQAMREAESWPDPDPAWMLESLYAEPPRSFERDLGELREARG